MGALAYDVIAINEWCTKTNHKVSRVATQGLAGGQSTIQVTGTYISVMILMEHNRIWNEHNIWFEHDTLGNCGA